MWDWIWIDDEDHLSDESVEHSDLELSDKSSEQEDSDIDPVPSITHSVTFKCIGQLKELGIKSYLLLPVKKLSKVK